VVDKELRRVCEERLLCLGLPKPLTMVDLCERVAKRRGIPIRLVPVAARLRGPCGLWVATPDEDLIFFEESTSRFHQDHIVAHEIGHIVSDHVGVALQEDEVANLLVPNLSGSLIGRVLGRVSYSTQEEREAEMLASLILEHLAWTPPEPTPPTSSEVANAVAELRSALQPRWRTEER
jgi:hypothetical protein